MKQKGWSWEHLRAVADRYADRFESRTEFERYLLNIGWDTEAVKQILKYLDRKHKPEAPAEIELEDHVPETVVDPPEVPDRGNLDDFDL